MCGDMPAMQSPTSPIFIRDMPLNQSRKLPTQKNPRDPTSRKQLRKSDKLTRTHSTAARGQTSAISDGYLDWMFKFLQWIFVFFLQLVCVVLFLARGQKSNIVNVFFSGHCLSKKKKTAKREYARISHGLRIVCATLPFEGYCQGCGGRGVNTLFASPSHCTTSHSVKVLTFQQRVCYAAPLHSVFVLRHFNSVLSFHRFVCLACLGKLRTWETA